jgi:hypothetical protein
MLHLPFRPFTKGLAIIVRQRQWRIRQTPLQYNHREISNAAQNLENFSQKPGARRNGLKNPGLGLASIEKIR